MHILFLFLHFPLGSFVPQGFLFLFLLPVSVTVEDLTLERCPGLVLDAIDTAVAPLASLRKWRIDLPAYSSILAHRTSTHHYCTRLASVFSALPALEELFLGMDEQEAADQEEEEGQTDRPLTSWSEEHKIACWELVKVRKLSLINTSLGAAYYPMLLAPALEDLCIGTLPWNSILSLRKLRTLKIHHMPFAFDPERYPCAPEYDPVHLRRELPALDSFGCYTPLPLAFVRAMLKGFPNMRRLNVAVEHRLLPPSLCAPFLLAFPLLQELRLRVYRSSSSLPATDVVVPSIADDRFPPLSSPLTHVNIQFLQTWCMDSHTLVHLTLPSLQHLELLGPLVEHNQAPGILLDFVRRASKLQTLEIRSSRITPESTSSASSTFSTFRTSSTSSHLPPPLPIPESPPPPPVTHLVLECDASSDTILAFVTLCRSTLEILTLGRLPHFLLSRLAVLRPPRLQRICNSTSPLPSEHG